MYEGGAIGDAITVFLTAVLGLVIGVIRTEVYGVLLTEIAIFLRVLGL